MFIYYFYYLFIFQFILNFSNVSCIPLMGFSSWNAFKRDYNESVLKENVDLMVSLGLRDLGYNYFNIDGEWWEANNKKIVKRVDRKITESVDKFPLTMKSFGEYVHNKGLLFGLYTSASTRSCFDRDTPMSYGLEKFDSLKFIYWGIDFIKIDSCGLKKELSIKTLEKWRRLLPSNILISNCRLGCYNEKNRQKWCSKRDDLYSMYRTSIDIKPNFQSIIYNFESITRFPFSFNTTRDPDLLEIGNGLLTFDEQITHIALWSISSSPLIISTDLRKINNNSLLLLKNKLMIKINQFNSKPNIIIKKNLIIVDKIVENMKILLIVNKGSDSMIFNEINLKNWKSVFDSKISNEIKPHSCLFLYSNL